MSSLAECYEFATKKNGKCLSKNYINQKELLKWQCSDNHSWRAPLYKIKHHNSWCPKCAAKNKRVSIDEAQNLAKKYEGKCLSKQIQDSRTKLIWVCRRDHEWSASFWEVSQKRWCKRCKKIEKLNSKLPAK